MKLYIAENLKRLRQSCGLTQEQLAERLGVSFQSVSRWENGLSYPDIELIPEIAAFFEVSTDVLMGVEKATMEQNLARDKKILRMDEFETAEEHLAFAEELHRKYPHDAEILVDLVYALSGNPA
ncbi:MAG: helix-turn-helix transcriptional regulator, partial [Clostridia bacterium]|nr:helix-turn-helix transcriptional regulator [Clostridia bacterium]